MLIFSKILKIDMPKLNQESEVLGVYWVFNVQSMFHIAHFIAVFNMVLCFTML